MPGATAKLRYWPHFKSLKQFLCKTQGRIILLQTSGTRSVLWAWSQDLARPHPLLHNIWPWMSSGPHGVTPCPTSWLCVDGGEGLGSKYQRKDEGCAKTHLSGIFTAWDCMLWNAAWKQNTVGTALDNSSAWKSQILWHFVLSADWEWILMHSTPQPCLSTICREGKLAETTAVPDTQQQRCLTVQRLCLLPCPLPLQCQSDWRALLLIFL